MGGGTGSGKAFHLSGGYKILHPGRAHIYSLHLPHLFGTVPIAMLTLIKVTCLFTDRHLGSSNLCSLYVCVYTRDVTQCL